MTVRTVDTNAPPPRSHPAGTGTRQSWTAALTADSGDDASTSLVEAAIGERNSAMLSSV